MPGTGNGTYKGPGTGRSVVRVQEARGSQQEMRSELDQAHEITEDITLEPDLGTREQGF